MDDKRINDLSNVTMSDEDLAVKNMSVDGGDRKAEKFDYNYSAPNSDEKRWIENIRRQYLPDERTDKVAEIKSLHKKAKTVPVCIAVAVGIIGTLVLGTGMALSLEWNSLIAGIIVGIIGMAIMLFAYPLYQYLRERGKRKYGDRIVKLADELSVDSPDEPSVDVRVEPNVRSHAEPSAHGSDEH